jgi:hypothetical protein
VGFFSRLFGSEVDKNSSTTAAEAPSTPPVMEQARASTAAPRVLAAERIAQKVDIDLLLEDGSTVLRREVLQSLPIVSRGDPRLSERVLDWESDTYVTRKDDGSVFDSWESAFEDLTVFLRNRTSSHYYGTVSRSAEVLDRLEVTVTVTQDLSSWSRYRHETTRTAEDAYLCFRYSWRS